MADEKPVPDSYLVLPFADGEYTFKLGVGQVAELQEKCKAGIGRIFSRLMAGRYTNEAGDVLFNPVEAQFYAEDIDETIRLALIGGGSGVVNGEAVAVNPVKAMALCRNYVHGRPKLETWRIASAILGAFIVGYDAPGAQKKSPKQPAAKPKDGSTSQPS